ncbi:MAG: hypothetical protein HN687_00945 [Candidatus Marinimicrobia bacterium]|nr:hypothetical protein [Candidatus Neomarinimicrobiota bacterium]MBT6781741.1 hypothetical protein [Candidatus Neomarinimicrobiota bacterium]MBT7114199.1 hypothetical protein [Candidatus Neomarinimicrobiota bacterium]MBT7972702.1 hypothetical protein [Candidatus Neomarinimicrobiota bacterium]
MLLFLLSCEDIGKGYNWRGETPPGFSRRYGTQGYDYGWNAAYSPFDGGVIIVGRQSPAINGQTDLWAIKTDSRGLVEWDRSFGGSGNEDGFDVIATSDGGFLFVGQTWSFGNAQQVYAVKTDFYGNTIWEKSYGGGMWDVGEAVIEVKGGGYVIAGHSNSPGISSGNSDMYLLKINQNGNLLWQKGYGNKAFPNHEWAYDINQLPDEGFLMVGGRDRYGNGAKNALVIRTDKIGNLIWEKEYSGEGQVNELAYSMSPAINGNYFICITENTLLSPELYQPKIIKIDMNGNLDWQRPFAANGKKYHRFKISNTQNGDIVLVGSSGRDLAHGYDEDAFMTRIDSEGNIIWTSAYGTYDNDDWGWSVFETPENNIVFVGSTKSFGASLFDIYLVGTNAKGVSQ